MIEVRGVFNRFGMPHQAGRAAWYGLVHALVVFLVLLNVRTARRGTDPADVYPGDGGGGRGTVSADSAFGASAGSTGLATNPAAGPSSEVARVGRPVTESWALARWRLALAEHYLKHFDQVVDRRAIAPQRSTASVDPGSGGGASAGTSFRLAAQQSVPEASPAASQKTDPVRRRLASAVVAAQREVARLELQSGRAARPMQIGQMESIQSSQTGASSRTENQQHDRVSGDAREPTGLGLAARRPRGLFGIMCAALAAGGIGAWGVNRSRMASMPSPAVAQALARQGIPCLGIVDVRVLGREVLTGAGGRLQCRAKAMAIAVIRAWPVYVETVACGFALLILARFAFDGAWRDVAITDPLRGLAGLVARWP